MNLMVFYSDGEAVELGDVVDVGDERFETDQAQVVKIGKRRLWIRWENEHVKPRAEWVSPAECTLLWRQA